MKNLKIRYIKIDDKYNLQFKRFGFWVYAMIPIKGEYLEGEIKSEALTPSKCLNKYLYSKNKSKADYRITEYPTIKKY
tara:strand:- start:361 stop:594 length:234 start_codon:yes stop_codon:yes gene_type:complete